MMSTEAQTGGVTLDATNIAEAFSLNPERLGKTDTTIQYKSSKGEIYQVTIPSEGLTTDKVKLAMVSDYKRRKNLLPQNVKV